MEFTLSGKRFSLTQEEILRKMQGVEPEPVRLHTVEIKDRVYPVKQVVSTVTNLSRADFTSHQAHQILRRLGLPVAHEAPTKV
jgi:hypothetical protein